MPLTFTNEELLAYAEERLPSARAAAAGAVHS